MSEKKGNETPKKEETVNGTMQLTPETLAALVAAAVKAANHDPDAEKVKAQKEAERQHFRQENEAARELKKKVQSICAHKHPEDGKWVIAWMPNWDGNPIGCCQRCQDLFIPGHPRYEELKKVSTFGYVRLFEKEA